MGKMKSFDMISIKQKLDQEKYERNKNRVETTGEKVVKVLVVLMAAIMFISVFSTFNPSTTIMFLLYALGAGAVIFRAVTVFKK